jgi:hypothetical protein
MSHFCDSLIWLKCKIEVMLSQCETKLNLFVTFCVDPQYQILSKSLRDFQRRNSYVYKPLLYAVAYHWYLKLEVTEFFYSSDLLVTLNSTCFGQCPLFLSFFKYYVSENGSLFIVTCKGGMVPAQFCLSERATFSTVHLMVETDTFF